MFFLFAGGYYYPDGGVHDLVGTFETYAAAEEAATGESAPRYDWWHVATIEDGSLVLTSRPYMG